LEKTFILQRVSPYFKNIRKEITKSPIFYFYDLGLRNFAAGSFGDLSEMGFIFQNFVFNSLKEQIRHSPSKICFWRTKDGAEIDFVVDFGSRLIPIEVKYRKFETVELTRALRSFIGRYRPEKALIINLTHEATVNLNRTKIYILPVYRLNVFFSEKRLLN